MRNPLAWILQHIRPSSQSPLWGKPPQRRRRFEPIPAIVECLEDRTLLASFTFAGFTFDDVNTPDVTQALPVGVLEGGDGAIITALPNSAGGDVEFPSVLAPTLGFNEALSLGRQLGLSASGTQAVNLPAGNDGTTDRSGFETSFSGLRQLENQAGDDFVVFESGSTSTPEAFMVQVRLGGTDTWTRWRYKAAEGFQLYDGSLTEGAFATAFDLSEFQLAEGVRIDAIRVVNVTDEDRMDGITSPMQFFIDNGFVLPEFNGGNNFPDPGPLASFTTYEASSLDPDPLYVGVLRDLSQPGTLPILGSPGNPYTAIGSGPGQAPRVTINNAGGASVGSFLAYDAAFLGGVSVALGDVNGDGVLDVLTGAGPGGGPHVRIFDGTTLLNPGGPTELANFFPFAVEFQGGVNVAGGEFADHNDGSRFDNSLSDDIVTAAGPGGGPHVRVFSGGLGLSALTGGAQLATGLQFGLANFFAFDAEFLGGVSVAVGDYDGDGRDDILTAAGPGDQPLVRTFDGDALPLPTDVLTPPPILVSFLAYHQSFLGGVSAVLADTEGDGSYEIITGAGPGGGPHVRVFADGSSGLPALGQAPAELQNFFAYDLSYAGGVRVGVFHAIQPPLGQPMAPRETIPERGDHLVVAPASAHPNLPILLIDGDNSDGVNDAWDMAFADADLLAYVDVPELNPALGYFPSVGHRGRQG